MNRGLQLTKKIVLVYYLPLWFQAVDDISTVDSGIHLLPMLIPVVVASIATGQLVSRVGYYTPFMILGACLTAVGSGLLTTLSVHTSKGKWIGFQIIYGFGLGCSSQIPNMAAQTVLQRQDVAIGASLMFFGQQLFSAVFTSVGQNVLNNQLKSRLAGILDPELIADSGATQLLDQVPADRHTAAVEGYNDSLCVCFQVALIMACLASLGAVTMEWRCVKKSLPSERSEGAEPGEKKGDSNEKAEDKTSH